MFPEFRAIKLLCALTSLLILLNGCASQSPRLEPHPAVAEQRIGELNRAILALGGDIDASEARRAARIAIEYSLQLAREYEVTDSAIVHNIKVNLGLKPRGLCVDWTRDLLTRLKQEKFHSLDLHWAVANYERAFRLEHSTVVVSARGESLEQGLVRPRCWIRIIPGNRRVKYSPSKSSVKSTPVIAASRASDSAVIKPGLR
jgi:hypothetical protein